MKALFACLLMCGLFVSSASAADVVVTVPAGVEAARLADRANASVESVEVLSTGEQLVVLSPDGTAADTISDLSDAGLTGQRDTMLRSATYGINDNAYRIGAAWHLGGPKPATPFFDATDAYVTPSYPGFEGIPMFMPGEDPLLQAGIPDPISSWVQGAGAGVLEANHAWSSIDGSGVKTCVLDTGYGMDRVGVPADLPSVTGLDLTGEGDPNNFAEPNWFSYKGWDHGTPVAATVWAKRNAVQSSGVAPGVTPIFGQTYPNERIDSTYTRKDAVYWGSVATGIKAIDWCAGEQGARVVNLSTDYWPFANAVKKYPKTLFVFAAGNNRVQDKFDPATTKSVVAPNAVRVAATTPQDTLAAYSTADSDTELAAPGSEVPATRARGYVTQMWGSSIAAPVTTGVAALVIQAARETSQRRGHDGMVGSASQIRELLAKTSRPNPLLAGYVRSGGVINAKNAIDAVMYEPEAPKIPNTPLVLSPMRPVLAGVWDKTGVADTISVTPAIVSDPAGSIVRGETTAPLVQVCLERNVVASCETLLEPTQSLDAIKRFADRIRPDGSIQQVEGKWIRVSQSTTWLTDRLDLEVWSDAPITRKAEFLDRRTMQPLGVGTGSLAVGRAYTVRVQDPAPFSPADWVATGIPAMTDVAWGWQRQTSPGVWDFVAQSSATYTPTEIDKLLGIRFVVTARQGDRVLLLKDPYPTTWWDPSQYEVPAPIPAPAPVVPSPPASPTPSPIVTPPVVTPVPVPAPKPSAPVVSKPTIRVASKKGRSVTIVATPRASVVFEAERTARATRQILTAPASGRIKVTLAAADWIATATNTAGSASVRIDLDGANR
jgi:hypothetical protein